MSIDGLGKLYGDGEIVVRQGEVGNCMFVIQKGSVEVIHESSAGDVRIATLTAGDSFGEMAIFDREARSATIRSLGPARILTIDKRAFLRRVQEDPTLAFHMLRGLSARIRRLNGELSDLRRPPAALQSTGVDAGFASERGSER
jgi:CRP-like cAMP-binding protein